MSAFRTGLLLTLVCLSLSFGLFLIGRAAADYEEFMSGYAVLTFNDSIEDSVIRDLLTVDSSGFASSPVSESSQWVILDSFDSLETVPLDRYFSRVASFDPRNDGYAEKLRDVFVRDGKRFVYIPLEKGNWTPLLLNKNFEALFADIPFSSEYYGTEKPLKLFFVSYAAASLCLLIICYLKKYSRNDMALVAVLLPVFSSLAFFGAAGIACVSLFIAFFIFYKDPLKEFSAQILSASNENSKKLKLIYKETIKPYRTHLLFIPAFVAAVTVIVVFSQLKLLFLLAVFASAFAVFFFSSKILSLSGGGHRRFNPVLIISGRPADFSFSLCMIPFAAAAFVVMFLSPYISGAYTSDRKFETVINEEDYYAHLAFQSGFSTRRLGAGPDLSYAFYIFDEDGLPSVGGDLNAGQSFNPGDFPSFPLRHLMDFFQSVNEGGRADGKKVRVYNWPVLAVLLLFAIPLFVRRKNIYSSKSNIKRFQFKSRVKSARKSPAKTGNTVLTDGTLSYNKYKSRILKDA